ncbi:MAG: HepT-like ribonuclease domain-containing protein [Tunicatimonas sp.]
MATDVLTNKAAIIERCVARIREDFDEDFANDFTKQDAVILNLQRACQACIDMAAHVVKTQKLGVPKPAASCFRFWQSIN